MLISPSKIKKNLIFRGRTFNFESIKKTHDNLVIVASKDSEDVLNVAGSNLFRPQQMMCLFVPRMFKPFNRSMERIDQKEYYKTAKEKTSGRIKFGRLLVSNYGNRNLIYDTSIEFSKNVETASTFKKGINLQNMMMGFMLDFFKNKIEEVGYSKNYLIFPVDKYYPNFMSDVKSVSDNTDPLIMFLRMLFKKSINIELLKKFDGIFFYNTKADALISINNNEELFRELPVILARVLRLIKYNNNEDKLDDGEGLAFDDSLDQEDKDENKKETIKEIIFSKIAKQLKAKNLTDFDAATKDEQDLIITLDQKIENILNSSDENLGFNEIVDIVEKDPDVKSKAIRYVETKKISQEKLNNLSRNIEKQMSAIDSISDIGIIDESVEPDYFDIPGMDERIKTSTVSSLDEQYNKKQNKKDLLNVITSFSNASYLPMTVDSMNIDDTSTDLDKVKTLSLKYKTDEGKYLSFKIDIPKIIDKRYLFIGGVKYNITKQITRLPIVKTKVDRVEITTNWNKMQVYRTHGKLSRKNNYIVKLLTKREHLPVEFTLGTNIIKNSKYKNDFEYEELSDSLNTLSDGIYNLNFNREELTDILSLLDFSDKYINTDSITPIGTNSLGTSIIYIENSNIFEAIKENDIIKEEKISDSLFDFIVYKMCRISKDEKLPDIGKSYIYTKIRILKRDLPTLAALGLVSSLTNILKRYNVVYFESDKRVVNPKFVEVKFKDKYLYYEDKIENTLLLNVLFKFDTENYTREDFDTTDPYSDYLVEKENQPMYAKNMIKLYFDMMIDPITKEVLKDLKLPTNIVDLILYGNTLLKSTSYDPQNNLKNYRIRGNEIINGMLYDILASAFMDYQRRKLNGASKDKIEIPQNSLCSKIVTNQSFNPTSILNPILELENIGSINAKGHYGINVGDAYTAELRTFDPSMFGIVSGNSTPFGGNAGITRTLTYNPKIDNIRGYIPDVDPNKIDGSNIMSAAELLLPYTSLHSDAPRTSMAVGQSKHTMPIAKADKQLICSGINKSMGFIISDDFCFKAKQDGFIEKIDNENKLAILHYDDGTEDAIDLSETVEKNSNSGFFVKQSLYIPYVENEKFNKGDILAYNADFFRGKGKDVDYCPGALAKIAIASLDTCFEDSTTISESLSEKCNSKVTMESQISLGKNATIHKIVDIGDDVQTGDHLIDYTASYDDPFTADFIAAMGNSIGEEGIKEIERDSIYTKYTGKVVDIKIYYNIPFEELSDSIKELINKYRNKSNKRKSLLTNVKTDSVNILPITQQSAHKINGKEFEGVLISFYVEYNAEMNEGDKLSYFTALKGVISKKLANDKAPISEYRSDEIVEGIITPTGVISRMTADVYFTMYTNKILIELGKQIAEIWHDKR